MVDKGLAKVKKRGEGDGKAPVKTKSILLNKDADSKKSSASTGGGKRKHNDEVSSVSKIRKVDSPVPKSSSGGQKTSTKPASSSKDRKHSS